MAFIFLDSFDHYTSTDLASKWTQKTAGSGGSGPPTVAAVGARSSSGLKILCANNVNQDSGALLIFPYMPNPSGTTLIAGFRFRNVNAFANIPSGTNSEATAGTTANCLFACRQGNSTRWWVRVNTTGTLSLMRGTNILATTSISLTQNTFQYIEIKVLSDPTSGTGEILIDGVSALTFSGNTSAVTSWDEIRFGGITTSAGAAPGAAIEWNIDDVYLLDGSGGISDDYLGDSRIDVIYPNADGNSSSWTRSTGSDQYATVDESTPNSDTDYNSTATVNNADTLNFPDVPVAGADIFAVQVNMYTRKTDAGAAGLKAVTRISGTDYPGTEHGVSSTYKYNRQIWDVKPSNSAVWVDSDVNAAEFGYKKTT